MSLKDRLRDAVLDEIKNTKSIYLFAKAYYEEINAVRSLGILNDKHIEDAIHEYVINQARFDYAMIMNGSIEADHTGYPEFLVYAFSQKGVFTEDEKKSMPIPHGKTFEEFCKSYGKPDLLSKLRKEMLAPDNLRIHNTDDCCTSSCCR